MGDIAMLAGIAKATLYNHFRTRDDVYRAAIAAEVDHIAAASLERRGDGLASVLGHAASLIADHPAVRRVAALEPAVLARLALISDAEPWRAAKRDIAEALRQVRGSSELPVAGADGADGAVADGAVADGAATDSEDPAVDLVLRYLVSQLLAPSGERQRAATINLLVAVIAEGVATSASIERPAQGVLPGSAPASANESANEDAPVPSYDATTGRRAPADLPTQRGE
jgi:AcrR family transcriptional regulator